MPPSNVSTSVENSNHSGIYNITVKCIYYDIKAFALLSLHICLLSQNDYQML